MMPIAIVENHLSFRFFLKRYLESPPNNYKVYEYDNGQDFTTRFATDNYTPAIVLMDIRMNPMDGYETTAWLKKNYPNIPVLVLSDIDKPDALVKLVRSGAKGCTSKQCIGNNNHLQDVMTQIISGKEYYDDPAMYSFAKKRLAMSKKQITEGLESLSPAELRVIRYLQLDKTPEEQASELFISSHTYNNHIRKSRFKLGLKSTGALYKFAVSVGLIDR